jgi:integrase/recombinase XerD
MINTAPTPSLRERMIEDMKLHRLLRATQRNYLRDVSRFANWLGRPPDTATDEDLRRYQIEQSETGLGAPAMNTAVSALRFFYARTLDRQDLTRKLHRVKHARALPTVVSREEVTRMLDATTSLKHQAILSVAYGAGLRASEVAKLKIRDVDSERMLLRVECGKGGRHRNAVLAVDLLLLLRAWWKVGSRQGVMHPDGWLFPGQHYLKPICSTGVPYRRRGSAHGGYHQAGRAAHVAAQLCDPSAGGRRRYPHHPGPAGSRATDDHRALYAGRDAHG